MTHQIAITLAITVASMGLFAWNIIPAAVVAIATALALYFAEIGRAHV